MKLCAELTFFLIVHIKKWACLSKCGCDHNRYAPPILSMLGDKATEGEKALELLTMCLFISREDFVEQFLLSLWVVHHDSIMEGDLVISQASFVLGSLLEASIYELCVPVGQQS